MSKTYETGSYPGGQIMDMTKLIHFCHIRIIFLEKQEATKHTNIPKIWYKYFSFIHFDDSFANVDEICQKPINLA